MNVEQAALWLAAGSRKGDVGESRSLRTSRNCHGSGLKGGQEDQEREGNWDVNGAGMSLKINDMRKCHPHQGFWRRVEVGDFASRDAGEANPRGLTQAVAIRYKDSGPSEPKAVIFRGIYRLQRESARFSGNLNAESSVRSRIRSLESFDAPSDPSIKQGPQTTDKGLRTKLSLPHN